MKETVTHGSLAEYSDIPEEEKTTVRETADAIEDESETGGYRRSDEDAELCYQIKAMA